ncbi:hypothetical protein KQ247_02655 [Ruegeria pomeroyi]|uniref:Uncharacterized protein n=1 Tax=Ruegeria pomeroyi TaxID=89184 RepID=A0A850LKR9_9RHOB|nr:hypothetical protein [Ruegeria pomeroyi]NVK98162.1 hypothetical protein [Ruegeria pomeroyi]NVL00422.1 hypothetical protein [Ruegeria pomeroyi]QWV09533.1 hypothetical protein KQ247_02655 [Ruegeria pomeroyi]HCE72085.1 hypothetical protein [Ruegeria sp.]
MPDDIGKTLAQRARDWGATNTRIEHGGKHPRLVGDYLGQPFVFVFPGSTGDWRAVLNCVSDLRRVLGVEREQPKAVRPAKARRSGMTQKSRAQPRSAEAIQRKDRYYAPLAQIRDSMCRDSDPGRNSDADGWHAVALRTPFFGRRPRFMKA